MLVDKYMSLLLMHSGIKGMHWGVRRYQNEDGTLTEEGKLRYSKAGGLKDGSKIASEGSKAAKSSKKAVENVSKLKKQADSDKLSEDAKGMSDEELKQAVWRLNMEKQYKDLKSSETSSGKEYITTTLEIAGSALAATASALTIAYTIKQLRS